MPTEGNAVGRAPFLCRRANERARRDALIAPQQREFSRSTSKVKDTAASGRQNSPNSTGRHADEKRWRQDVRTSQRARGEWLRREGNRRDGLGIHGYLY